MSTLAATATLAHGFTFAQIESYALMASRKYGGRALSMEDKYDHAWHAIVELLYTTDVQPHWTDLYNAGRSAIQHATSEELRQHGITRDGTFSAAPRFAAYWETERTVDRPGAVRTVRGAGVDDDFTEHLIEKMALPAALSVLTDVQYEALATLAACGSGEAAAATIGISGTLFHNRLSTARAAVMAVWLYPETPRVIRFSKQHRDADTCSKGHSRAEHSFINTKGYPTCRICRRNASRRRRARESNEQRDKRREEDRIRAAKKRAERRQEAS